MDKDWDAIVCGGGPAGICAAWQSARAGLRTLLVERSPRLGGTTTSAGVNLPGLFHAWGRQVIAGIGWRLVVESATAMPDFSDRSLRHWQLQPRVDVLRYCAAADAALQQAGVRVLAYAMPHRVRREGDGWLVELSRLEGPAQCRARMLIDCTGDAGLAVLAGLPVRRPEVVQPATIMCRAEGYTDEELRAAAERIRSAYQQAVAAGLLRPSDVRGDPIAFLQARGDNKTHLPGIDGSTSAGRTAADREARRLLLRLHDFYRGAGLPGFRLVDIAPETGIRETRTIAGMATVTGDDYRSGRRWPDALCHSFYPIDIHRADGSIDNRPLRADVVPSVPLGAQIPQGSRGFLAAGRCVSSDREANSALRVQASCMAMGQAAGAVAAIAVRNACEPLGAELGQVRRLLTDSGAIVPETALAPATGSGTA